MQAIGVGGSQSVAHVTPSILLNARYSQRFTHTSRIAMDQSCYGAARIEVYNTNNLYKMSTRTNYHGCCRGLRLGTIMPDHRSLLRYERSNSL